MFISRGRNAGAATRLTRVVSVTTSATTPARATRKSTVVLVSVSQSTRLARTPQRRRLQSLPRPQPHQRRPSRARLRRPRLRRAQFRQPRLSRPRVRQTLLLLGQLVPQSLASTRWAASRTVQPTACCAALQSSSLLLSPQQPVRLIVQRLASGLLALNTARSATVATA